MKAHAFEHIHDSYLRAKNLIKIALLKYCGEGDWGRFVAYRDSLRGAGDAPSVAWVKAYERFRGVIDPGIDRAKADELRMLQGDEKRMLAAVTRAKLKSSKARGWKGVVTPYHREKAVQRGTGKATEAQKMMPKPEEVQ